MRIILTHLEIENKLAASIISLQQILIGYHINNYNWAV